MVSEGCRLAGAFALVSSQLELQRVTELKLQTGGRAESRAETGRVRKRDQDRNRLWDQIRIKIKTGIGIRSSAEARIESGNRIKSGIRIRMYSNLDRVRNQKRDRNRIKSETNWHREQEQNWIR
ncbi:hypothetical protein EVAR_74514_1 [Eumeta japonica]|uniref:Uncharacterized protein n=1 Tax=Eumeta variegata TaxID=151549 RepID=A0A4C1TEP2_EUMVA|nr:hypothetical protein EVAR_74514_1 [Eumeta japonica]